MQSAGVILGTLFLLACFAVDLSAQGEIPPEIQEILDTEFPEPSSEVGISTFSPQEAQLLIEGEGTSFAFTKNPFRNISLESSKPIAVRIEPLPDGTVVIGLRSAGSAKVTKLTLFGLEPSTTYFRSQDGLSVDELATDSQGTLSFQQEVKEYHRIHIERAPGTVMLLPNGVFYTDPPGPPPPSLVWDSAQGIYKLIGDLNQPIRFLGSNITLDGQFNTIQGGGTFGIYLGTHEKITIRRVTIRGYTVGITGVVSRDHVYDNVTVRDNTYKGIRLESRYPPDGGFPLNNTIQNCTFSNNGYDTPYYGAGMEVTGVYPSADTYTTIIDSTFDSHPRSAIHLNRVDENEIKNNTFQGNGFAVDMLWASDNLIEGNSITGDPANGGGGVFLSGAPSENNDVYNNTFQNLYMGMKLDTEATNNTVRNNSFSQFDSNGVFLVGDGNTVRDNTFTLGRIGILTFGSNNEIKGNLIEDTSYAGMQFARLSYTNTIENNTINEGGTFNIRIYEGGGHTVTGNALEGASQSIYLTRSPNNTITENTLQAPKYFCINVGESSNNTLLKNTLANSPYYGLMFRLGGSNVVRHNNFLNNTYQAYNILSVNIWDGGYPTGGNYWSDHVTTDIKAGPLQDEAISDGIVDSAYDVDANNKDNFPFKTQDGFLVDSIPPRQVKDLAAEDPRYQKLTLRWTAPGDDYHVGTADSYEFRVRTQAEGGEIVTDADFQAAHLVTEFPLEPGVPTPQLVGSPQSFKIKGLESGTVYYFAMRTTDNDGNTSLISNSASNLAFYLAQSADLIDGTPEVQLESEALGMNIESVAAPFAREVALLQGLSPVNHIFEITPSVSFTQPAVLTFKIAQEIDFESVTLGQFTPPTGPWVELAIIEENLEARTKTATISDTSLFAAFVPLPDTLPPRTVLDVGSPSFLNAYTFISSNTPLSLTAVDDRATVGDESGVGVAVTSYAVNAAPFATFTVPFFVVDQGTHTISFFSVDHEDHAEVVKSSEVFVDNTAPETAFDILGASALVDEVLFMAQTSSISLSAQDAASGVSKLEYRIDGEPVQVTPGSAVFTLAEGAHTISFQATDNVENQEALRVVSVTVNGTTPVTEFSIVGASAVINTDLFMAEASSVSLSAQDMGSGVDRLEYRIDGGPLQVTPRDALFVLPEGLRTVTYQAVDKVENREELRAQAVKVDGTAPFTQLTVDGSTVPLGPVSISPTSFIGFLAEDPVDGGVASGVQYTEYSVDGGPFDVFTATFTLAIGTHTVSFRSVDNVENREELRSVSIEVIRLVVVSLDIDPNTLNLKSKGQFVAAFIEVSGAKGAVDIDTTTPRITAINDVAITPLPVDTKEPSAIGDKDSDGIPDLEVKFDRADLIALLPVAEQVEITVEGSFKDGETFTLSDFIRTIKPGAVPAHLGGTAAHAKYRSRVSIPPGALSQNTGITILRVSAAPDDEEDAQNQSAGRKGLKRRGRPFEFGPEGTQFSTPVTLTLPYDEAELNGADASLLRVAYWNPDAQTWEPLPSTVNKADKTVSAQTTHFSKYQVLEAPKPAATPPFDVGEVYVYPSPAVDGAAPTFHVETGAVASVTIRVYDISGSQVHETTLSGAASLIDDGQGPQSAYEYAWQARIASGVYLYVVRVERNGQEVVRIGKFAVIR